MVVSPAPIWGLSTRLIGTVSITGTGSPNRNTGNLRQSVEVIEKSFHFTSSWSARPFGGCRRGRQDVDQAASEHLCPRELHRRASRGIACVLYEGNNGYCALVAEVEIF